MIDSGRQTLQEFFDSPLAHNARHELSPSAAEPVNTQELLALEPGAADEFARVGLDYPQRYAPIELREKVAGKFDGIDSGNVVITSGVDEALALLFTSVVEAGDRIVVLSPCYPPHLALPLWRGAEVVDWPAREENNWAPDLDELRDLVRKPTKMVVVTFPQNPTGFMPDDDYLDAFMNIVQSCGALLISDEIYTGLPLDGDPAPKLACRYDKAISLNGLSKSTGLPGLRVGWMATRDQDVLNRINQAKMLFNCYLPGPIEFLTAVALRHEQTLLERNNEILVAGLAAAKEFFDRHDNLFAWTPPAAGVVSFPRWLGPGGTKALSDRLLNEVSLAMAPSLCFDAGDQNFRLGLCRRNIPEALAHLDAFLSEKL